MNNALAREVKALAQRSGKTFTALVEQALTELLAHEKQGHGNSGRRKRAVHLPVYGDPARKLNWEQIQAAIDQAQYEDDLQSLGIKPQ